MDRLFSSSLAVTLACGATPVVAAEAADAAAAQPEIVVTGQRQEYGVESTSTATKTNTDIKRIPQALTVISEKQIEDQTLRSIADLLMFVPGATPGTGEGNRDQITLRGNNTTADFFVDGVRDDVQYFRDFYNVDRVEALKGPNAMIFGRGGGGGVVNRVLKRSSLHSYRNLLGSGDGFGGFRIAGDFDQPLGKGVGVRLNAMYEDGESFRHHVDLKRWGLNPTAGILIGPDTRVDLSYEHFHDRRTADRGIPSVSDGNAATVDEPLEGFDRTFFGDPDQSFSRANGDLASLAIEHRFGGGLTLRNRTLLGDYDKFYQNIYPNGAVNVAGNLALAAYNDRTDRRNLFSQTDLIWESRLGGIDQTLLFGFELGRQRSEQRRLNGFFQPSNTLSFVVPVSDPTVDVDVIFRPFAADLVTPTNFVDVKANVAAAYVQDQIRPADWLEIVVGLRFDRFALNVTNLNNGAEFDRTDNLWSPRLGVIVKPTDKLSFYASYSRSWLPQSGDQFNSLNLTAEALKPEKFDNYEIGAKWEPVEGLLATAALYQLDRTNTQAVDPTNPANRVLTGAQRSRGLELGLERSITSRWQVSAGYAWQDAEITETTTAAPAGRKVPLVPRHSFSLWNRYDFTRSIGAGLGVIARSKSYASISNNVKLPGYARLDAAVFYKTPWGIETQVNFENILGADYFPTAHNDNNIEPGRPRTVRVSVGYSF